MNKLAIEGGTPVRSKPFPTWPVWDNREEKQLLEVLHSGTWSSTSEPSPKLAAFQERFAVLQDAKYALGVFNGTVALQTALQAAGIGYGDEVIIPPYTFIATATSCLSVGAIPVFVDIDPQTYNIAPAAIEEAITPRTKAIMPVHIGGCPADLDSILDIAERHRLLVIEDACQSHGSAWKGRRVGAIGDLGCFSFQASKNINAGEGGVVVSDDPELIERAWSAHNCGRIREGKWYQHEVLGSNFRMTEWQAAILLAQMTRFDEWAGRREENAHCLAQGMTEIPGLTPQQRDERITQHGYHLFVFRYNGDAFGGMSRAKFLEALHAEGIPASSGYTPLYNAGAIRTGITQLRSFVEGHTVQYVEPDCPVTKRACSEEGVWLGQTMLLGNRSDTDDILAALAKIQQARG